VASLPLTGTGKKQGTTTQTAPNQTAGPLPASVSVLGSLLMSQNLAYFVE